LFRDAVLGYLARCREEADELAAKSYAFLSLAQSIDEKEQYSYSPYYSEGTRAAALAYIHWIYTGQVDETIIENARVNLQRYYDQGHAQTLDRTGLALSVPLLLYTEAYTLIEQLANRLWGGMPEDRSRKATGVFGDALRIATASNSDERNSAKEKLRKKMRKQLFHWIDRGNLEDLAYTLYALFPRPDGAPCRLIEECWVYVDEQEIEARLQDLRRMGSISDD